MNRRGLNIGTGNFRENKVDRARRVSADIQLNGIYLVGKSIHDDCVIDFTCAYKKLSSNVQNKRVDVDK
ncbi:MAG: hypothetical protein MJ209_01170 [archaeon]|nr:hypothetical protein [archaeon]